MTVKYFQNFPDIKYLGYNCKNITASAKLVDKYVNAPYVYYRFDIDNDQRADQVAHSYYEDSYYSWLVYYSNKITDPYYDWYLSETDFARFVAAKYGSVETAQKKILFFRTNWYNDDREIAPSVYEEWFGSYKAPYSNYWNPKFDADNGNIISYVRKINDSTVLTNKTMKLTVSNNTTQSNTSKFSVGDLVDIKNGITQTATAEVSRANTSVLYIEKILGSVANGFTIASDSNSSLYCTVSSQSNSYVAGANSWTVTNIADDEYVYWEPVYAYDYEVEQNTVKRTVNLVDNSIAFDVYDKLVEELKDG